MLGKINQIKKNFYNNLKLNNNFKISKSIIQEFKKNINFKMFLTGILLISTYSNTANAINLESEAIKSKLKSLTIEHIEYKQNDYINLDSKKLNELDILGTIKTENPFFSKNIVTIIIKDNLIKENKINKSSAVNYDGSHYLINSIENQKKTIKDGIDYFSHRIFIDKNQFENFSYKFKIENKNDVLPLFTLHELAHSSFEQASFTSINNSYKNFGKIQIEIHSDISAILMYSKLNNFENKKILSLIEDLTNFRMNNTIIHNDWKHDSTLSLMDLKDKIINNEINIKEIKKEDISPYAAQLTKETFNKNYSKDLINILEKEGIPTKKNNIFSEIIIIKNKLNSNMNLNNNEIYIKEISSLLIKKDIKKLNDQEISNLSSKIENRFEDVSPILFSYFSKNYRNSYKELLHGNKNKLNKSFKI